MYASPVIASLGAWLEARGAGGAEDAALWDLFMRARWHMGRYNADDAAEGLRLLRRLVHMPTATPAMCAEANYLIAQVSMNRSEYSEAKEALREALQKDPQHAQCHFLFAQSNDQDGDGQIMMHEFTTSWSSSRSAPRTFP